MAGVAGYRELLDGYHDLISRPEWEESRAGLVVEMDRAWSGMTAAERNEALEYAAELYARKIDDR